MFGNLEVKKEGARVNHRRSRIKSLGRLTVIVSGLISCLTLLSAVVYKVRDRQELFEGRYEKSLACMYGEGDLSASCLFTGGFINFGKRRRQFKKVPSKVKERNPTVKRF